MLKTVCDICGREIKKDEKQYCLTLHDITEDWLYREKYDICSDCYAEIKKEVNGGNS